MSFLILLTLHKPVNKLHNSYVLMVFGKFDILQVRIM